MNLEKPNFEQNEKKEGISKRNIVVVDFLRHGSTEYKENFATAEEKKEMNENYPRDLTLKGEEEVRVAVNKIVDSLDPENDIVVLWSSPAWRAQGSEELLREELDKKNIPIYKDSSIKSMRNFDQSDKEFMNELWTTLAPTGQSAEIMYARGPEFQEKNDKFESQPEVKRRMERVFNYINYIAKHVNFDGKRLRIIGVSHFEFLNPLAEDLFGIDIEQGEGVKKGEEMKITFDYDLNTEEVEVSADFRGEHKEGITFDKKERNFILK